MYKDAMLVVAAILIIVGAILIWVGGSVDPSFNGLSLGQLLIALGFIAIVVWFILWIVANVINR